MSVSGTVVFCDDIRFESNGKAILIGVYTEDLIPSSFPQLMHMSFWVRIMGIPEGDLNLTLNAGANGKNMHTVNIDLTVQEAEKPVNLYFSGMPLSIEESGQVFIEISGFPEGFVFRDKLKVLSVPEFSEN